VLDGARMRMARKPSALARELLRNFPKGKRRRGGRRRKKKGAGESNGSPDAAATAQSTAVDDDSTEGRDDGSTDGSERDADAPEGGDEERSAA
jgi:hypothetical protein